MLYPKRADDPRFLDLAFAPRGGGTVTNGQALTDGLVVDLSRQMNAILEINAVERWVRVQACVIKDQLRDYAFLNGWTRGPQDIGSTTSQAFAGWRMAQ